MHWVIWYYWYFILVEHWYYFGTVGIILYYWYYFDTVRIILLLLVLSILLTHILRDILVDYSNVVC